uniref:Uncharacterized protein n=1 Tax=Anguilla anguilla TaxID=7936 RepID=A0A0E9W5E3_ANGAN
MTDYYIIALETMKSTLKKTKQKKHLVLHDNTR